MFILQVKDIYELQIKQIKANAKFLLSILKNIVKPQIDSMEVVGFLLFQKESAPSNMAQFSQSYHW